MKGRNRWVIENQVIKEKNGQRMAYIVSNILVQIERQTKLFQRQSAPHSNSQSKDKEK